MSDDKALREAIRREWAYTVPKKDLIDRIDELEAKLAKAVETLEYYNVAGYEGKEARTTLAELKGQNDE